MPRYEYRKLMPLPEAEIAYDAWIERLDREFMNRDPEHREWKQRQQRVIGHRAGQLLGCRAIAQGVQQRRDYRFERDPVAIRRFP